MEVYRSKWGFGVVDFVEYESGLNTLSPRYLEKRDGDFLEVDVGRTSNYPFGTFGSHQENQG